MWRAVCKEQHLLFQDHPVLLSLICEELSVKTAFPVSRSSCSSIMDMMRAVGNSGKNVDSYFDEFLVTHSEEFLLTRSEEFLVTHSEEILISSSIINMVISWKPYLHGYLLETMIIECFQGFLLESMKIKGFQGFLLETMIIKGFLAFLPETMII